MEYIKVTQENIENEHICCAISNNKDIQVASKKEWLAERFDEGLIFFKSTERGKCFIEYIPAENAWNPIDADGYMYLDFQVLCMSSHYLHKPEPRPHREQGPRSPNPGTASPATSRHWHKQANLFHRH